MRKQRIFGQRRPRVGGRRRSRRRWRGGGGWGLGNLRRGVGQRRLGTGTGSRAAAVRASLASGLTTLEGRRLAIWESVTGTGSRAAAVGEGTVSCRFFLNGRRSRVVSWPDSLVFFEVVSM